MDDLHLRVAADADVVVPVVTGDLAIIEIREPHRAVMLSFDRETVDRFAATLHVARERMDRSHARADLAAMRAAATQRILTGRNGH